MTRHIARFSAALLLAASLASCEAFKAGAPTVTDVQAAAIKVCAFVPTTTTVINLLAAAIPGLSTASALANAICQAVTPAKAGEVVGTARVHGVPIEGNFAR